MSPSEINFSAYLLFSQQDQYILCHSVLADFVDSFEIYANFKEVVWIMQTAYLHEVVSSLVCVASVVVVLD